MKKDQRKHILKGFLESLDVNSELMNIITQGFDVIFEDVACSTSTGLYSQGIGKSSTNEYFEPSAVNDDENTTNYDTSEAYVGSEAENFNGKVDNIVDKLNLFDLLQVTTHGDEDVKSFHDTDTYSKIINDLSDKVTHHILQIGHVGDKKSGVYILPVNKK